MPNLKLTELPTLSPINFDSNDLLYIVDLDVQTSKKISYKQLAGDTFAELSAYDVQNTINVNFLSGAIVTNAAAITAEGLELENLETKVGTISGLVDNNTTNILAVSTIAENNTIGGLTTDILEVSGQVVELSSNFLEIEDNDDIQTVVRSTTANVDFLSGAIFTNTNNIGTNTSSANDNTLNIANIRTLSGFSGTVTEAGVTQTRHVPIVIGTTTYKLLLAD
tara:strand:+ start:642 stop:1310 length:669 start_codon:yes stop_codon:yes gene_type:complete